LSFAADDGFDPAHDIGPFIDIAGHEDHADTIVSRLRKADVQIRTDSSEEFVGNLHQDASPVTGVVLAARSATMRQIGQDFQGTDHDVVRLFTVDSDNKTDAAGIVLEPGIIQALLGGNPGSGLTHGVDLLVSHK